MFIIDDYYRIIQLLHKILTTSITLLPNAANGDNLDLCQAMEGGFAP
jgi:hypothetical protein